MLFGKRASASQFGITSDKSCNCVETFLIGWVANGRFKCMVGLVLVTLRSQLARKLQSMGLVQLEGDHAALRCQLYRQYFSERL